MKRILSFVLAVCLVLGLSVGVFAATLNVSADKTDIKPGDEVTVTVSAKDAFVNYTSLQYRLFYDADLFDINLKTDISKGNHVVVDPSAEGSAETYLQIIMMDTDEMEVLDIPAGTMFATIKFTAKASIDSAKKANFELKFIEAADENYQIVKDNKPDAGAAVTVTVTPAAQTTGYSVAASTTTPSTTVGSNATVSLGVNKTYNSYYFEVSYDSSVLQYVSCDATKDVTVSNGTLKIAGYGADRTAPVVLTFEGLKAGSSAVTITKANIDEASKADTQDAPAAEITNAAVTITVTAASYNVTLDKTLFNGDDTVTGGTDYTFSANDTEHYGYSNVTATMGGETVEVTSDGNGNYTIANVTGDLVISGTRTGKQYSVTVTGNEAANVTAATTANYGTDFTFTFSGNDASKNYTVTVTVGGTEVTPTVNGTSYTIAGTAITGNIVINAASTDKPAETVNVNFEGNAIADATGKATAKMNTAYTFTVAKTAGYTYTVTAKNADGDITLTESNGTYTIAAKDVTKDITITVNKTANRTVEVSEYVKANNTQFWLVTVKGTVADGNVLTYNNAPMLWSAKYDAYAYLVIDTTGKTEAQMKTAAEASIGEAKGEKTSISYGGDVNATGTVDVNDAQLVYNMYNAKYTSFDSCSMEKFLRADMNGDKTLTVNDAAAIVNIILSK